MILGMDTKVIFDLDKRHWYTVTLGSIVRNIGQKFPTEKGLAKYSNALWDSDI